MCRYFTVLAQQAERCQILQCEHGTIHLLWCHATIQLTPTDFLVLAAVLERASPASPMICESCFRLFLTPNQQAHLWLANIGIWLDWPSLELLRELVRTAEARLAELHASAPQHPEFYATRRYGESDRLDLEGFSRN